MVLRSKENSIGAWSFLTGVILAVIIGVITPSFLPAATILSYSNQIYGILVLLGLIVGFTIKPEGKDAQSFLIAGAVLVVVSKFGMESITGSLIGIGIGSIVISTFSALLVLFVPATIIVAIKTVFSLSRI